jgi:arylsulfatase A-like enzyme
VEKLKEAGYWTAAAGKWHLGDEVKDRFDEVISGDPAAFQLPAGATAEETQMVAKTDKSGCGAWVGTLRNRPAKRPFFLWLAAFDPHRAYESNTIPQPHKPEDVLIPPYIPDTPATRSDFALYYDEISRLDSYIGLVMAELQKQGVADNTMILFFSDNGRPFPRDKTTLYDSGIKTPWIVRWPALVGKGSTSKRLVSSVDIAPTILELAGIVSLDSFEGTSFVSLLRDPEAKIRDTIFAEDHWHDYEDQTRAVRSERFKYIRNFYPDLPNTPPADAGRSVTFKTMRKLYQAGKLLPQQMGCFTTPRPHEELYDTESDPHEMSNLVNDPQYQTLLETMRQQLHTWQSETGDKIPDVRTPDEFDRQTGAPLPVRKRPRPSKKEMQMSFKQVER